MDAPFDMKRTCLDLSTAAIALFDLIESEGIGAPIDNHGGLAKLKAVIDISAEIQSYYAVLNLQHMVAMGVSPAALLGMIQKEPS